MPEVDAPKGPTVDVPGGSMEQVAVAATQKSIATHASALQAMPAKTGGRKHPKFYGVGGASEVTVHPPNFVSAGTGSTNANTAFAKLMQVQHQQAANSVYDKLGNSAPMQVAAGKKRRHSKKNGRSLAKSHRKNHGTRGSARNLRRTRRSHRVRRS